MREDCFGLGHLVPCGLHDIGCTEDQLLNASQQQYLFVGHGHNVRYELYKEEDGGGDWERDRERELADTDRRKNHHAVLPSLLNNHFPSLLRRTRGMIDRKVCWANEFELNRKCARPLGYSQIVGR